jgi:hypothetical protein
MRVPSDSCGEPIFHGRQNQDSIQHGSEGCRRVGYSRAATFNGKSGDPTARSTGFTSTGENMTKTVIQHVLSRLHDIGVKDIFGVEGDFVFPVQDAVCSDRSFRFVGSPFHHANPNTAQRRVLLHVHRLRLCRASLHESIPAHLDGTQ